MPDFKIITVTPAGRQRYMKILHRYLMKNRHLIHKHQWWVNTGRGDDIEYMQQLAAEHPDFYEIYMNDPNIPLQGGWSIYQFFKNTCDPECVYIRLDDDIVWMDHDAIRELINFRLENPGPFLVSGNVVNNAMCNYIHQRIGAIPDDIGKCTYNAMCEFSWRTPENSRHFHTAFFQNLNDDNIDAYKFPQWKLLDYERFSINVISWFGRDFADFGGEVYFDEEPWLAHQKTLELERPNVICGKALFVHFAFFTQREYLEGQSNCLDLYDELSQEE